MQNLTSDVRWIRPADFKSRDKDCQIEIAFADTVTDVIVTVYKDTGTVSRDAILNTSYTYHKFDRYTDSGSALGKLKTTASLISFLYQFKTIPSVTFNVSYINSSDETQTRKYIWFDIENAYVAPKHNYNSPDQEELDDYF